MTSLDTNRLILECECGNPEHLLVFDYYKDEEEDPFRDEINVSFTSNYYEPFWKRVKIGLKYIFHRKSFMTGDCVMFTHRNITQLKELTNYLEERIKNEVNKIIDEDK